MTHKTGYHVYAYGEKTWHRTLEGAKKRKQEAQNWCHNVQIIKVATGELINGNPE